MATGQQTPVSVLVNRRSGGCAGQETIGRIADLARQHGLRATVHEVTPDELATGLSARIPEKPAVIVAAGGDGTSEGCDRRRGAQAGTRTPLAVPPGRLPCAGSA